MESIKIEIELTESTILRIAEKVDVINSSKQKVNTPGGNSDKYYTVPELSELLKITENTLRIHLRDGILKGSKKGKNWLISQKSLNNYLNKKDE